MLVFVSHKSMTQTPLQPNISPTSSFPIGSLAPERLNSKPDQSELAQAQKKYRYNYSYFPPLALVDHLAREEMPSMSWWSKVFKIMISILVNATAARHGYEEQDAHQHVSNLLTQSLREMFLRGDITVKFKLIWHFLKILPHLIMQGFKLSVGNFEAIAHSLVMALEHDFLKRLHLGVKSQVDQNKPHQSEDGANCLSAYDHQFATLELPAIAQYFHEDECFAYFRIAGPNPVMLERIEHLDGDILRTNFPVTNAQYQIVMGDSDSLEQAVNEGRIYLADYQMLDGALNGCYPNYQKYIDAPLALFAVPPQGADSRQLRPIAIQCQQTPSQDSPIFIPNPHGTQSERYAWEMAKRSVQIADGNFHEAVTHLARTHLFISPFVIATHRQLPQAHPVSVLLRPHFEGTLSINHGAHRFLMAARGGVDTVLAATIDCARTLTAAGLISYGFNQAMLPHQLQSRGLDDPSLLPNYPYRDDSLLLWGAIEDWVTDYVSLYYPSDEVVANDPELQAWAAELQAFDGGRVKDFGESGKLVTCTYLVQALTLIIFTASAQHAAVNFPQGDLMVYTPAMPLAGYAPAPNTTEVSHNKELQQLPPLHQSLEQLELTYLLGQVYHTQLGHYAPGHFTDTRIEPYLTKFNRHLEDIEVTIDARNEVRPYPYPYLKPSQIPQSINI